MQKVKKKIDFTIKHRKNIINFAETTTPAKKIEMLDDNIDFKIDFIKVYPDYYKHLIISNQRMATIERLELIIDQMKEQKDEGNMSKVEEKLMKKVMKLNRKLHRKYRYRLRESYFDNRLVNEWILYYNKYGIEEFLPLISRQVDEIIVRQIKRFKMYQFGTPIDDLIQEVRIACLTAMKKFDVTKGKTGREAFNYFSLICIKAGRMVTLRHSHRYKYETPDSDVVAETLADKHGNTNQDMMGDDDALTNFYRYFYDLFNRKERMQLLLQILVHYVLEVGNFTFKKNDFVKYAKSHGFTGAYINKFLGILRSNRSKFGKDFLSVDIF